MQSPSTLPVFNQLDLIVPDVPEATAFFQNVLGLTPQEAGERFAQFGFGAMTLMLSPDALVSMETAQGMILHFQVPDVSQALELALRHQATLLWGPEITPWGTQSAIISGPGGIRVDLYSPASA